MIHKADNFFITRADSVDRSILDRGGGETHLGRATKAGASPEIADELANLIPLHKTNRCLLFTHHDCGAYGGFQRFRRDALKEFEFHQAEHQKR